MLVGIDHLQGVVDHGEHIREFLDHGAPLFMLLWRHVLVVGHGDGDGPGWVRIHSMVGI
jgi:hypothetical protein